MRARMRALQGEAVRWDGTNADDLQSLAGDLYEGTHASSALIRNREDEIVHVRPGWVVSKWDGTEGVSVSSGGAWETWAEEVP